METWQEIRAWRGSTRAKLLARRMAVPRLEKQGIRSLLRDVIGERFPELRRACIGFYWPIKGEIDLRHVIRHFLALGAEAALPVVVEKQRPLEFWAWSPRMKLGRGIWNIPVPVEPKAVRTTALLVPLLGFDSAGYRLGYGGGYYDRTLATMNPKPLTIGVGYELGRLDTIYPQPHDIPLDAIVTEVGFTRFRCHSDPLDHAMPDPRMEEKLDEALKGTFPASDPFSLTATENLDNEGSHASPQCFMHELGAEYLGYMSERETIVLLNLLLEGERAGARAIAKIARQRAGMPALVALHDIARDEARFCAMLSRHITRLGGTPSLRTGAFFGKLVALDGMDERIDLLNRGQAWVVRKLQEALPKIGGDDLRRDLRDMLEVHERNIQRCAALG